MKITLTNQEEKNIKSLLKDSSQSKFHKRLQILRFRSKGMTYDEIADLLDCNKNTVVRTLTKYRNGGLDSLLKEARGGRHHFYLSFEEEKAFLEKESQNAINGKHVTVEYLHQAYQKLVGRKTSRAGIYALLKRHGWRKISPRPQHPKKADADTILASKNKISIFGKNE